MRHEMKGFAAAGEVMSVSEGPCLAGDELPGFGAPTGSRLMSAALTPMLAMSWLVQRVRRS